MSTNNTFRKDAGNPVIEKLILTTITGDKIDIFNQLDVFNIYEDIYSPVLTGDIKIFDNLGLFYNIPICGQEKLTIKFYSSNYDPENLKINFIHRTFDIIKITDVKKTSDHLTEYVLHFVSPELKKNETIQISKSYQNTTMSNIIATLMTEDYDIDEPKGLSFPTDSLTDTIVRSPFLADTDVEANYQKLDDDDSVELFIEKTKFKEPWVTVPYMKPFEIIQWLSSRSLRQCAGRTHNQENNEAANFLFFENKRGFQFTTIDTLLENKDTIKSKFFIGNGAQNKELANQRFAFENRIIRLEILDSYDVIGNIRSGLYSSRLQTYDLTNGEVKENDYDYINSFINTESSERGKSGPPIQVFPGIEDYPFIGLDKNGKNLLTTKPLSKRLLLPFSGGRGLSEITSEQTERNCDTRINMGPEAYVQKRMSQLSRWTNFRIMVDICGNSVNKVGDVVFVDLKELNYKDNDYSKPIEKSSKYYSGHYLITSIRHSVSKLQYNQTIELAKDSYGALIGFAPEGQ